MEKPRTGAGPIRITYVIAAINTENAGTEGHLLRLIRSLDRQRFAPSLVVMQRSAWTGQFDDPSIPLHVLDFKSFRRPRDWSIVARMADAFRSLGTQIAELHFIDAHFAGALACARAKVPVVLSCRRDLGHQYGIKGKILMKMGNRHVTRFIANAGIVADRMSELEGIRRDRFDVIYNGIDLAAFDEASEGTVSPEFEQFIAGKRVVSIAANLRPVKNIGQFVDAAAAVAARFEDVVFAIMGDGTLRDQLEQQAARLGISEKTIFLGSVPHVAPYLRRSWIGCLSSTSEGFSNSVVEYMAAGLPVVATRVGGIPEAVVDGENGYVVPPGDSGALADRIGDILDMTDIQRSEMARACRKRVEESFTMERQLHAHESLYNRELMIGS